MFPLLAQTTDMTPTWIDPVSQFSGMALVGAGFIYVLRWLLERNTQEMKELTRAIHINSLLLLQVQREQIRHDSLCAGFKCHQPVDDEHWRQVAASYTAIMTELGRASDAITDLVKHPP